MSQPFRTSTDSPHRGRIDRNKPILMRFNGCPITAFAGDTMASALLAHGIHFVGRSFKYHRPRGIFSHGTDEPNALLDVDRGALTGRSARRDPNNRATVVDAFDGLIAKSQNHWPTLNHDIGAINDKLAPLFVAGFYYKTFMWPQAFWTSLYEPIIRYAAGLGKAPELPDPDRYTHRHAHAEVVIVGAGPAGIAAALAASADRTQRVILVDEQAEPGGTLLHDVSSLIDGKPAPTWLAEAIATLDTRENVTILPRTTAFGYYNHNHIALAERVTDHLAKPLAGLPREWLWQVRAGRVVLATGAHERPLVFADNDRPGIMLAESVRVYLNRYGVLAGHRVVIATSGASAYKTAVDLKAAGADVTIVDLRLESDCGAELLVAVHAGIEVLSGHTVVGSRGRKRVDGLVVAKLDTQGRPGPDRLLSCDCVGMSAGWTPTVHLFSQSRGKLVFDTLLDAFVPGTSNQAETSVGACKGHYDLAACLSDGFASAGKPAAAVQATPSWLGFQPVRLMPTARDPSRERAFVDFQNDVTAKDIKLAVREGFTSIEHVKRYTTTGMATDQGKTSNMNVMGLVAGQLGKEIPSVGTTTFRLPYTPTSFGAIAGPNRGDLFDPARLTPMHDWAASQGAVFEDVGLWKRAWYFPRGAETMHQAVQRECKAVRQSVGIFDASTLGKIEVVGPDAAEFMNRMYINSWTKLAPGRCRYGLMLKEDGFIMDDGVVARIAADRFHVTTTTSGAPRVLAQMEDYLQTEWPHLRVFLTSITEQWAVIAVQGRKAREVLRPLVDDIDLSDVALPHMAIREGHIAGVPTRLFRVSFTGELGYEINVPADYGQAVWEAVCEAGKPHDITPYGTETMHVLRAEKGFIIVGQETDGTVTPDDVGLAGMIAKAKPDFVGKRSLARPDLVATGRKQLVGLLTDTATEVLDEGAQIVDNPNQPVPMKMLGHVTSSYMSPNCGRGIALAMIADGRRRIGDRLHVTSPNGFTTVKVTEPVFFDAEGVRLHA